eukprot:Sdes_comp27936_c0_seq1m22999
MTKSQPKNQIPSWVTLSTSGNSPSPRVGHSSTFIPFLNSLVVIGGADPTQCFADVHLISLDTLDWEQKATLGDVFPPRYEHSAVFKQDSHEIIVFGGADMESSHNDVFLLSL